jgi:hypothetical protein
MFDFGKLGAFMDILPKIEGAVPEVLDRLTQLETTMLALAKRNIELLEMIEKNTRPTPSMIARNHKKEYPSDAIYDCNII